MADRRKRKLEDFDPNKSDSNDSDYDNAGAPSSARKRKSGKSSNRPRPQGRKPTKRRREGYGDSEDEIEDDSEEASEEDSFQEDSDEDEQVAPINPKTGRRQRAATRKHIHYEESEDEIQATDDDALSPRSSRPTLVVKLRISSDALRASMSTRHSTRNVTKREPTPNVNPSATNTRRSSRISRDSSEPMMALTDSGKHTRITRAGSAGMDAVPARETRGGKGPKKLPSAIMEASQEDLSMMRGTTEGGPLDFVSQLQEHALGGDDFTAKQEPGDDATPIPSASQIAVDAHEDFVPGSEAEADAQQENDDEDDEDEGPLTRKPSRSLRSRAKVDSPPPARRSLRARKSGNEQSSDFEPEGEDEHMSENVSSSDELQAQQGRGQKSDDSSSGAAGRRSGRLASKRSKDSQRQSVDNASELDLDEIADEAADLEEDRRRNKRPRRGRRNDLISLEPNLRNRSNRPDYRVFRPELAAALDDDDAAPPTASQTRNRRAAAPYRTLFSTLGPFGGAGGPAPVFGGPEGTGATGGVDSDSSDDEMQQKAPRGMGSIGGAVGMTPTSAAAPQLFPQRTNADPAQATSGAPDNFGKVKDRKALADADPLGVDPNVSFDGVGGLGDHIDRLKEMVALPLLYPEIFMRMHVTPPRGVLFHGPPGTGKTLLARALASSVSSHGKKVTFYMRKGADALSKWVGEAERQLRLLFEEARKNQPSIIFFDEIDGLAPVRSSKQEQIHASIVATLLALMDGMDGRGQVIVIGATNRPDSVDPALRRPGRFDREFYFPLPNQEGRRAIIDIHTKGWEPALKPEFKDKLSELTKGYGGADLRALCTEAALNAVQGTYPQIYSSNKKLLIDPSRIKVLAKDFMISVNKIIPSSERSATSGAAPLKKSVEPLLRKALADISQRLNEIVPPKKKTTALEEAMYDDRDDEMGFEKETLAREFESARIFRPRLLVRGLEGMGQQYLGAALLNKFEGLHVQNFDLATLLKDSTRSPEATVVQMFEEVKRHKPSVIYIPNVDKWYETLADSVIKTFTGLLRSLPPTEPVLLLGVLEATSTDELPDPAMMRDLFGYSMKNMYELKRPDEPAREAYFAPLLEYIHRSPTEFPDPMTRKKRRLEELPEAPITVEAPKGPTKEEQKAQKRQDRHTLNTLKLHIQQVMDQIKLKYRKFRTPPIDDSSISYLYDEQDPTMLTTDLGQEQAQEYSYRPFKLDQDDKGVTGLREVATDKFYYNLEIVTIEKRLSNGYYKRPKDFLADIKRLAKDAKNTGDQDRIFKANEMLANVEVDMTNLEVNMPALAAECEAVYNREQARERERVDKAQEARRLGQDVPVVRPNVPPPGSNTTSEQTSGPVHLGVDVPGPRTLPPFTPVRPPSGQHSSLSNGYTFSNGSHHGQSNGSTVPSRLQEDVEMSNSQDTSGLVNPQERADFDTQNPGPETQTQKSQRNSVMQLAPGSQPQDYHNSASTTTSGQKTSDRSSGHSANTRITNGDGPDFAALGPAGGSQFPDTQEHDVHLSPSSQPSQPSSQPPMGPPPATSARREASIPSLLNNPIPPTAAAGTSTRPDSPPPAPRPSLIPPDGDAFQQLARRLVQASSGLSVEQLEQVMASLMNAVWDTRGDWNRNKALWRVRDAFNDTVRDIEECQLVLDPSQKQRMSREAEGRL